MEQVLPAPATPPVSASHSIPLPMPGTGPSVDPTALTVIATAVRGRKGSSTGHSRLPLSDRGRRRQPPLAAPRGGRPAEAERGSAANRRMRVRRGAVRCVRRRSRFVQTGSLAPARAHSPLSTGGAARGRGRHASRWRRCRADLGSRVRSHGRGERARGLAGEPPGRGLSRRSLGRDHWAGARRVPGRACGFAHVGRASLHRSAAALDGGWGA